MSWRKIAIWILLLICGFLVLGFLYLTFKPYSLNYSHQSSKALTYDASLSKVDSMLKSQNLLSPVCNTQLLTHGKKTGRVIVFFHGYTNCPAQFTELGKRFYDWGYNVFIPVFPHHGLSDRMTPDHANLTGEELVSSADQFIDIATGLGDTIIVAGISAGGVLAAWLAEARNNISLTILIAPSFGFKQIPESLTRIIANLFIILPNKFEWWTENKMIGGPQYAYPQFSTHALAQILKVGFNVYHKSSETKPAHAILVITNENDKVVNNDLIDKYVMKWRNHGGFVHTFKFEKNLLLNHDLIDPNQPDQKINIVYPQIISIVDSLKL